MEQIKQYYLKWRSFLNTDKSHLVQSSLALILLLILTPFFPSLDGTWSFAFPVVGLIFFGLRAAEEKTRRTQYDFLCIVIWLLEILILNCFNV